MAVRTRTLILETARDLFNQHGYHEVTMRQIANQLGISPGNLTYYFPHKADLVDALMDETFEQTFSPLPILTMDDLLEQFRRMLITIRKNAFVFLERERPPKVTEHNLIIRRHIAEGLQNLVTQGIMTSGFTPEIQNAVLRMLLMSHMSWLRAVINNEQTMSTDEFVDMHRMILSAYLVNPDFPHK